MAVDYDLVIVGSTPTAIAAARAALRSQGRVALVSQRSPEEGLGLETPLLPSLSALGAIAQQQPLAHWLGLAESARAELQWPAALAWHHALGDTLAPDPAVLAAQGLEVILGQGAFRREPTLGFNLADRCLRSRAYLIATGSHTGRPAIEGLDAVPYWTPETLATQPPEVLPERLLILGGQGLAVAWAEAFARFGVAVTLITRQPRLLPQAEPEAVALIQAQLEADGVRILTGSPITQARMLDQEVWVQAGNDALAGDRLLVVAAPQPNLTGLNLEAVRVRATPRGLSVKPWLQTAHPRIYACGAVLGGDPAPYIGHHEAAIAVENALWGRRRVPHYQAIPQWVPTQNPLISLGLTEAQASQQYHEDAWVLRCPYKALPQAHLHHQVNGFAKLIVRPSGQILGAHILGPAAPELMSAIALLQESSQGMPALERLIPIAPSYSEVWTQLSQQWRDRRHQRWGPWLEALAAWRRARAR